MPYAACYEPKKRGSVPSAVISRDPVLYVWRSQLVLHCKREARHENQGLIDSKWLDLAIRTSALQAHLVRYNICTATVAANGCLR